MVDIALLVDKDCGDLSNLFGECMFSAFLNVNYELEGFSQFPCTPTLELIISSFLCCLQFLWSYHYPHPTIFCFYGLQVSRVMPSPNSAPSQVRQKLVLQAAPQKSGKLNTCSTLLFPRLPPKRDHQAHLISSRSSGIVASSIVLLFSVASRNHKYARFHQCS